MIPYIIIAAFIVLAAVRLRSRALQRRAPQSPRRPAKPLAVWAGRTIWGDGGGPVRLVASREIRERTRRRVFRVGTVVIAGAVAAAVVIPVLRRGHHAHVTVATVGEVPTGLAAFSAHFASAVGASVTVVPEADRPAAETALRSGSASLVVIGDQQVLTKRELTASDTSATAQLARAIAATVGAQRALESAGLPPAATARLAHPAPVPVTGLLPASQTNRTARLTAVYGLILLFVLLSQYGMWILMGVVEEKSSRVVEVLLATLRPSQLLTGKVAGIGAVALGQAAVIVGVALGLGAAVGSDLLQGSAPLEVLAVLCWLVLGYVLYCWVYAAGGSLAERQEHVQSLAFPLQLPILVGYVVSISSIGANTTPLFVRVLAFIPLTAPFAMPVMVAQGTATWWEFLISALLTVLATLIVARVAAVVYQRAVLLTGRRVRVRDVLRTAT